MFSHLAHLENLNRFVRNPNRRHSGDKSESPRLRRGECKLRDTVPGSRILMTVPEQVY